MSSKVVVMKSTKTGNVLNVSSRNANEGWIMVTQKQQDSWRSGRLWAGLTRTGFLRSTVAQLIALGLTEGKELEGRIVIQDQLEPIVKDNLQFGLRVPQTGATAEERSAVRIACEAQGVTYMQSGKSIYRKVFYSPYPEGHPSYEADLILSPDNLDEVNAFVGKLKGSVNTDALKKAAKKQELEAIIANEDSTAKQVKEAKAELAKM